MKTKVYIYWSPSQHEEKGYILLTVLTPYTAPSIAGNLIGEAEVELPTDSHVANLKEIETLQQQIADANERIKYLKEDYARAPMPVSHAIPELASMSEDAIAKTFHKAPCSVEPDPTCSNTDLKAEAAAKEYLGFDDDIPF